MPTGTEFYGLKPPYSEQLILDQDPRTKICVLDLVGNSRILIKTREGEWPDNIFEYPLPRFFKSIDELTNRPDLSVSWEIVPYDTTKVIVSDMLVGLDAYVGSKMPGNSVWTQIKTYEQVPHGEIAVENYQHIQVAGLLEEINESIQSNTVNHSVKKWTGGLSGNIFIARDSEWVDQPRNIVQEASIKLCLPLLDLDIRATSNYRQDLAEVTEKFRYNKISGYFALSGEAYHFIADFVLPYEPYYWQSLGTMANVLTPQNATYDQINLTEVFTAIATSQTLMEAQNVSSIILHPLQGIPSNTKTSSDIDARWLSHRLRDGVTILRSAIAKGYEDVPKVVARVH